MSTARLAAAPESHIASSGALAPPIAAPPARHVAPVALLWCLLLGTPLAGCVASPLREYRVIRAWVVEPSGRPGASGTEPATLTLAPLPTLGEFAWRDSPPEP